MEYPGLNVIGDDRCELLRWKGMFVNALKTPGVPPTNDRIFWCQKTHTCLGPDDKLVDDYECNPARSCYRQL
jgi:hypothetical protein